MNYEPYNQYSWKASDYATVQSSEFGVTVHITDRGFQNKIYAIKAVRELTGMGLKEAKDLVDSMFILHNTQKVRTAKETAAKLFADAIRTLHSAGLPFDTINDLYRDTNNKFYGIAA